MQIGACRVSLLRGWSGPFESGSSSEMCAVVRHQVQRCVLLCFIKFRDVCCCASSRSEICAVLRLPVVVPRNKTVTLTCMTFA